MFIDRVEVELTAGKGGDGCMSFRREKFVPKGGPDGGDGGIGGSIILEAKVGVNSLSTFAGKRFFKAEKGQPGQGRLKHGRGGHDLRLYVPCGTSVIDAADGYVIRDLTKVGDEFVIARGGRGGHGNARFKSATNQVPREKTPGTQGEYRHVFLELKSIADVGLIGKPNAGKSTLLSRISSARPEIADYPFTTKYPNLGIVEIDVERSFVLADIPGLIEGASEGVGLGHEFLRHIERAGLLVHLVEPMPVDGSDPIQNYGAIRDELRHYDTKMADRDELVVMTKCELDTDGEVEASLKEFFAENPVDHERQLFKISAAAEIGLTDLTNEIMDRVTKRRIAMIEAGEDIMPIREVDQEALEPKPSRVPPHKQGMTASLSNEQRPMDVEAYDIWAEDKKHRGHTNPHIERSKRRTGKKP
ncbi:GTP-binding protein [Neorhodopirellula lusitana]|uniref:GTPase Obg n=1 Tax=Neorhodopirellula lusitana TaxID=445327 RepID=A0ABY1QM47_9BACT|nr:GTPase ObgE [Neorhodopirellula lusitana]SMP75319.1 GTP-binding protein [Neorhodopirellula lusitana]